jgi:hypothetical protein
MSRWDNFLDSLNTAGGAIFLLVFLTLLFSAVALYVTYHPVTTPNSSLGSIFSHLLSGVAGALLGALSSRTKTAVSAGGKEP